MEEDVRLLPSAEQLDGSRNDRDQLAGAYLLLGKTPVRIGEQGSSSFNRLPRTVIEQILYLVDPNTFASLALLNRKWRRISDSAQLYAHHLYHCPSFSLTQKSSSLATRPEDFARLKYNFIAETRRNTFDVFLRPRRTLIKLISASMSSSTAFPQGEAFRFAFSPNSHLILCISSSRIVVVDVASESAVVRHELKTWRRPLNATILDDGSLLAVVSSSHQVNIYQLSDEEARHVQELKLNDVPRTLALCPTGGVLAIAYDDRIEVYAVGEGALPTERRAVRCAGVDSVSFSSDGVMLLGSSGDHQNSGLVTVTVPFYTEPDTDYSPREIQVRMWTTQILFPDVLQGYSHACLLPFHSEGDGNWVLGYDKEVGAFRAIGANNAESGATYLVSPASECGSQESLPDMLPSVDCQGELAALGFHDAGLWVYGLPDRLDIAPVDKAATAASNNGQNHQAAEELARPAQTGLKRLQQSVIKPKMLISGHKMSEIPGITAARWVQNAESSRADCRRLVAVAPGGVSPPTIGDEDVPVDGGRVLLLDFERSSKDGDTVEISIELGEAEPKMLSEPNFSLDTEVELERRRTRLHRANPPNRGRAAARESYPAATSSNSQLAPFRLRRNSSYFSSSSNDIGDGDTPPIPDTPYDNTQPRSHDTLRRAATAAATSHGRYNPRYQEEAQERPVPQIFQVPHESDADNWVPPPPPYSREPDAPLPEHLRRSLLPTRTEPGRGTLGASAQVQRSQTTRLEGMVEETSTLSTLQRLNTITGSRLASRMRRITGDSETHQDRRHSSFIRRRATSASRSAPNINVVDVSEIPPVPQIEPQAPMIHGRHQGVTETSSQANPNIPISSPPAETLPVAQPTNFQTDQPEALANQSIEEDTLDLQDSVPALPVMASNLNSPFSLSSPNLQISDPQYAAPEVMRNTWLRPGYHRTSQSQDIQMPAPGIPPLNRRASTDPTLSTSSNPSNDLWRRRIEEWNERTIYERSKRRTKCLVM